MAEPHAAEARMWGSLLLVAAMPPYLPLPALLPLSNVWPGTLHPAVLVLLSRSPYPASPWSPLLCSVGEDFYPALPASHTAHIANAAFNSLMTSAIAFPDWDM